jgi:hypothetical protein
MDRRSGINTALKSQKSALLGSRSQLVILASDRIIQIACSEADNQTGGVVQNAGELNSF